MDEAAAAHGAERVARAWERLGVAVRRTAATRGRIGRGETQGAGDDIDALIGARLANSLQALKDLDDRTNRALLPELESMIIEAGRDVPDWRRLIRMRDRLVHRWHDADPQLVRQVVAEIHPTIEWLVEVVAVHPVPVESELSILDAKLPNEVRCVVLHDLAGRLGVALVEIDDDAREIRDLRWAQRG